MNTQQQLYAVSPTSRLVESSWWWSPEEAGDCRRIKSYGSSETMFCCPVELAGVPDTATQLQYDAGQDFSQVIVTWPSLAFWMRDIPSSPGGFSEAQKGYFLYELIP